MINAVNLDYIFQMQMCARRIARTADLSDNLPRIDELTRRNVNLTAMSVSRVSVNVLVINQYLFAVSVIKIARSDYLTVKNRSDICAVFISEINSRVKFPCARNWMNSPAERTCYGKFNRLNLRRKNYQREKN